MSAPQPTLHFRACNLCEAICGLRIQLQEGEIVSIRGDDEDPLSRGHICPKAVALQDLHSDPDRLRRPQRRRPDGSSESVEWEPALDAIADRLRRLRAEHGADSVAVYAGNPGVHNSGILLYGLPLLRALRTKNRFSATSVDQLPHHVAATELLGHQLLLPVPDLDRTDFLLVLGANPLASNGSLMTAPGMKRRLTELRRRGGRLVVVDPRRTETARAADRHHFIRPGTDALLLLALVHTLFEEGLTDLGHLAPIVDSRTELATAVEPFAPERVADTTGIPAAEIRTLAREFAAAPSAVCYSRLGVSAQEFGGLCHWLTLVLDIVTGNLDRPGGAMLPRPAIDLLGVAGRGRRGRWHSRVRGLPEIGGELPAAALAEEIDSPGPGRIRALLTLAGNPVLSTPNGGRLEAALPSLDFMVSIDPYLNETTRHADWILPPTSPLQRDHYDLVFHGLAVRNTTRYSPPLFPTSPDERHDWQILAGLHRRLARGTRARIEGWVARRLGPRGLLDLGLRRGPYGAGFRPGAKGLTLKRVEAAVHGIDLGPLQPGLPDRLRTPNRRIDLAPRLFLDDLPRLAARWTGGSRASEELLLIGRRQVRSNNSWMHNVPRLMRGPDRCTLLVHPADAARLGLAAGRRARVRSRTGEIEVPVEISDEMMAGVVSLPHGWGHHRPGTRLSEASRHPGASLNDLTDELHIDALSGTAALTGTPVRVFPVPKG